MKLIYSFLFMFIIVSCSPLSEEGKQKYKKQFEQPVEGQGDGGGY